MQLVAHRGFADEAPENTLGAVDYAARAGANAVEVDVRAAADGTPVVVHDAVVDRVTATTGRVDAYDPAELAAMNVRGSGDGIPTLEAVLSLAADRGLAVNVELKEPRVAAATVALIADHDIPTAAVWLSSFEREALERVHVADPARQIHGDPSAEAESAAVGRSTAVDASADVRPLATAFLTATRRVDPVATAMELGCVVIHPQYRLTFAGDLVARAHAVGLEVYPWTLDSPTVAAVVMARQVDGLIADVSLSV